MIVGIFIICSIIGMLHRRCCRLTRAERRALHEARRNAFHRRRSERQAKWSRRKSAFKAFWRRMFVRGLDDEEKETMLAEQRCRAAQSQAENNLATTMEQEIAQFRTAADVVGDMVAAEEGRMRRDRGPAPTPTPFVFTNVAVPVPPPSPTGAFPDYMSVDEPLPAYEPDSAESSVVADGYRPGSDAYTPSASSDAGSSVDGALGPDSKS
jgi:hypothetical protein